MHIFAQKTRAAPQAKPAGSRARGRAPAVLNQTIRTILYPASQTGLEPQRDVGPVLQSADGQYPLRAKLTISQPGDALEVEADRWADQVVRMQEPIAAVSPSRPSARDPALRRKCAECEKEDALQRKAVTPARTTTASAIVEDVLRSPGRPLDKSTLAYMEPRFGHDFSRVRVHADAQAAESARAVSAHAYTAGTDIVFGRNQFAPSTSSGRKLLAHELAHVVQQGHAGPAEDHAGASSSDLQRQSAADEAEPEPAGLDKVKEIDPSSLPDEMLASVARAALATDGYEGILEKARAAGLVGERPEEETPVSRSADQQSNTLMVFRQGAAAAAGTVFTRWAVAAGITSQLDSPAPGPADVVALGILLVGAAAAVYTLATHSVCDDILVGCLESPWQPDWNRGTFGPRKDCGACYRECKHAGGVWPDYKCPR